MKKNMRETFVSYTLQDGDRIFIIEHVPARVCEETGEQFFSPSTVEKKQGIIHERKKPVRIIKAPVYEYA